MSTEFLVAGLILFYCTCSKPVTLMKATDVNHAHDPGRHVSACCLRPAHVQSCSQAAHYPASDLFQVDQPVQLFISVESRKQKLFDVQSIYSTLNCC
jgi:hypothetical protein